MIGATLLRPRNYGQIYAQNGVHLTRPFDFAGRVMMVDLWQRFSSTAVMSRVQNRYPSPLKRSVHTGGPLFLIRPVIWAAGIRHLLAKAQTWSPSCARICLSPRKNHKGERVCGKQLQEQHLFSRSGLSRHVIMISSAARLAPGRARPSPLRRAGMLPPAPLLAVSQACSATIWAFATDLANTLAHLRLRPSQPVGPRRASGFFYARSQGRAEYHLGICSYV